MRALQYIAADTGTNLPLVDSLMRSNEAHKHRLFEYAVEGLAPGARVLMAGLAFKAGTDDLRESPNVDLARKLLAAGFELEIYDPGDRGRQCWWAPTSAMPISQLPQLERTAGRQGTGPRAGGYARSSPPTRRSTDARPWRCRDCDLGA